MNIFSLQTKKHLVGWSLVIGVILNFVIVLFMFDKGPGPEHYSCLAERQELENPKVLPNGINTLSIIDYIQPCPYNSVGWPVKISYFEPEFGGPLYFDNFSGWGMFLNSTIWTFVTFIVLSLIKYLRNKKKMDSGS